MNEKTPTERSTLRMELSLPHGDTQDLRRTPVRDYGPVFSRRDPVWSDPGPVVPFLRWSLVFQSRLLRPTRLRPSRYGPSIPVNPPRI